MDFSISDEQAMLKKSAAEFLKSRCSKSFIRELEASDTGHSPKLWKDMAQLGWMGIIIPEDYGGVGWSLLELAILFEEIGRAALDGPLACTVMGTMAILEGGTEEQKKKLLPQVASGDLILTMAVAEPEVAYEPSAISTPARKVNEGYIINGTKLFVPYATVADYIIVAARTKGNEGQAAGITLFIVAAGAPGINTTYTKTIAPDKQYQVDFADVKVAQADILGDIDNGSTLLGKVEESMSALQCAEMVGVAEQQLKMAAEYTKQRVQFDRPIGSFQAVQHRLADMFTDIQGARWTSYQAIDLISRGEPAARELSIAKAFTSDACQRVAFGAQQLHGGIGVDLDYDLHFYFRKAKAMELKHGPAPIHFRALESVLGLQ